ncbi:type IV secretion system protein, partial [Duganella phyllosphaerae]|uniref:type IV secretion system protein n=1 Tax=Duganella phyllosphaerae TaxID=762836 RepID=UPI003FCC467F
MKHHLRQTGRKTKAFDMNRSLLKVAVAFIGVCGAGAAFAAIPDTGLLDDVANRFLTQSATWGTVIKNYASWLFWVLATISMVWTFGLMALRKADIGEFFAEFVRFTVTTGFFWWLLSNGPDMAIA